MRAWFDVFNIGLASLGLPIALGGTSNHFRRAALDAVGGWDAWNVTEDADLGLRLARFGYAVGCLDSTTSETAPLRTRDWLQQRRRWAKGWLQTAIVLMADAPRVARDLGPAKTLAVALLLVNLVVGPLLLPVFSGFVAWTLACSGLPCPRSQAQIVTATVSTCVLMLGLASAMGYGCAGLRARRLWHLAPHVPLLLPII
jgi:Glycosyltransferases, probably involved in cell wall biogenesis